MHEFPHHYRVTAQSVREGVVQVSSPQLPTLDTMPPPEFGGEPGYWSPETLLAAAVADCFILSFRAVAQASRIEWDTLACDVDGTLERVDGVTRFTHFEVHARLRITDPEARDKAVRALEKSEKVCLITQSLNAKTTLDCQIEVAESA